MTDSRIRWEQGEAGPSTGAPAGGGSVAGTNGGRKQRDDKVAQESMHHDGSFGRYMALKVVKLREQFDAQQLQATAAKSDIFRGVSIYVNGFTRPSHAELKQLMALHGGRFENYLYRDSVTHIICNNLPDTKIKQLAHERKPIPIVRPEWVVASINAGRLLPTSDFQLEPLSSAHPNQRRLFDFKRHEAPQMAPAELYPVLQQQQQPPGVQQQRSAAQQQQPPGIQPQLTGGQEKPWWQQGQEQHEPLLGGHHGPEAGQHAQDQDQAQEPHQVQGRQRSGPYDGARLALEAAGARMEVGPERVAALEGEGGGSGEDGPDGWRPAKRPRWSGLGSGWAGPGSVGGPSPGMREAEAGYVAAPAPQRGGIELAGRQGGGLPDPSGAAGAEAGTGGRSAAAGAAAAGLQRWDTEAGWRDVQSPPPPGAPHDPLQDLVAGQQQPGQQRQEQQRHPPPPNQQPYGYHGPGPWGASGPQLGGPGTGPGPPSHNVSSRPQPPPPPQQQQPSAGDGGEGAADRLAGPGQSAAGGGAAAGGGGAGGGGGGGGAGEASPCQGPAQAAQVLAAELRAASDLARGPPRSTRNDPRFMETFFRASRLHFIGTWKSRIEALMAEVEAGAPNPALYARGTERVILHVDMDCFFASVAAVGRPELAGRPLAVCHSNSARGTGEVSSANYQARSFGVRADMFIAEAKRRCPDLVVVPYEFDKYQAVSEQVYRILMKYTSVVQPISCDEAFMDVTGLADDPEQLVARLRAEIASTTQCTASAGIGPNMLVARLATKRAKPNGQFRVTRGSVLDFLGDLKVEDLPGVGWSLASKLEGLGITRVRQVWSSSRALLQKQLGAKVGADLWAHAHGVDERRVEPPKARKSVGAEVNYGIRFEADAAGQSEAERFLADLAGEVAARLSAAGVRGRSLTLKVKRRQAGAPEPAKFMGHGACDNISRSVTLGRFTAEAADLRREAVALLRALSIPPEELRGLGLTVTRLDNDPASHTTRPSAQAPVKLQAPPRTIFDASKPPPWAAYFHRKDQQQQQQQRQQHQQQDQNQKQGQGRGVSPGAGDGPHDQGQGLGREVPLARSPSSLAPFATPTKPVPTSGPEPGGAPTEGPTAAEPGSCRRATPPPEPGGGGSAAAAAAGAASPAAASVKDVPSWYASLYNEWSPVSIWEQQRRQQRQPQRQASPQEGSLQRDHGQQQKQRQLLLPPRIDGGGIGVLLAEAPSVTAAAAGPSGGVAAVAPPQPRPKPLPKPRLHPLFAALLSQSAGDDTDADAITIADTPPGAPPGVDGHKSPTPPPPPAAVAAGSAPGGVFGVPQGSAMVAPPPPLLVPPRRGKHPAAAAPEAAPAVARRSLFNGGNADGDGSRSGGDGDGATVASLAADAPPLPATGLLQPQPQLSGAGGATAASGLAAAGLSADAARRALLPLTARPAASGSYGTAKAAAPARPATSAAASVGAVSGANGGLGLGRARPVESIDLSLDMDGDMDGCMDREGRGGDGGREGAGAVDAGREGGGFDLEVEVVGEASAAEAAGETAGAGAQTSTGGAHRTNGPPAVAARAARSESTVGPTASTSAVSASVGTGAGAAGSRWPAGFLRPTTGAAAGTGRGHGGGRGRGGGSGGGRVGRSAGGGGGVFAVGRAPAAATTTSAASTKIDLSVLAELPPELRREVEREYGLLEAAPARRPVPAPAHGRPAKRGRRGPIQAPVTVLAEPRPGASRGGAVGAGMGSGAGAGPATDGGGMTALDVDRRSREDAAAGGGGGGAVGAGNGGPAENVDLDWRRNAAPMAAGQPAAEQQQPQQARERMGSVQAGGAAPGQVAAVMPTTLADVDPAVLDELPAELRDEIMAALRRSSAATAAVLGNGATAWGSTAAAASAPTAVAAAGPAHPRGHTAGGHSAFCPGAEPDAVTTGGGAVAAATAAAGRTTLVKPTAAHLPPGAVGAAAAAAAAAAARPGGPSFHGGRGAGGPAAIATTATAAAAQEATDAVELQGGGLSDSPDVLEVTAVAALPADADLQRRIAAAAEHMFVRQVPPAAGTATAGPGEMGFGSAHAAALREALLGAIRSACAAVQKGGPQPREGLGAKGEEGRDVVEAEGREHGQEEGGGRRSVCGELSGAAAGVAATVGGNDRRRGGDDERRLQATCMALALWLISQDHDLEGVVTLLRRVVRVAAASAPADGLGSMAQCAGAQIRRVVRAIQDHVQHKFGFRLKVYADA